MPKKTFTAGEVLTAADVNSFLMDQSVMTFATSAARGSAIGTATEGMVSYLNDTNSLEVFDGSAWNTFNPQSGNAIINGAFDFWQRGTSFVGTGFVYMADRWMGVRSAFAAGGTFSQQSVSDSALPNIQFATRLQRDSGNTNTGGLIYVSALESADSIPYAGKTVTLSFFARRGTNYSGDNSRIGSIIYTGTGTNQSAAGMSGWTGVSATSVNHDLTTTWQRFTQTVTLGTNIKQIGLYFQTAVFSGTAGANDWVEITGVQLEAGSAATPFRRNANSIQGELAACQRYYYRVSDVAGAGGLWPLGTTESTTLVSAVNQNPVTMRADPTSVEFSNLRTWDGSSVTPITNITVGKCNPSFTQLNFLVASGLTQFRSARILVSASSAGFIGISAEL
jgi:hypothetical protein